jgi:hypothetical protein
MEAIAKVMPKRIRRLRSSLNRQHFFDSKAFSCNTLAISCCSHNDHPPAVLDVLNKPM